ncbi:MAG: DUF87 domain-containing protein, partial [Candidatus Heimdallarchaeota archaeon]|nr:DUF87 domain-containing protein [Candidatus Heimdallarchaeota archaeon]
MENLDFLYQPLETLHLLVTSKTEISMEIRIKDHLVSIRFFVYQQNCTHEEVQQNITQELQKVQDAFQQSYPNLEVSKLTNERLREAFNQITNGEILDFDLSQKNLLLLTETGTTYLSVLLVKGIPRGKTDTIRPLDSFIRSLLKMNAHVSFVVSFRPGKLGILGKTALRQRYRKLQTELDNADLLTMDTQDSRKDLQDEYLAYINQGYWITNAYVTIHTGDQQQHEILKDRIRTVIVNTFGSIDLPLKIIEVACKPLVNGLGRILTRGILSDRAQTKLSSQQLSSYIHLPEQVTPGVERIQVPEFQIPPTLSGNLALGDIFFQGTTIYPAKISLEDLRLHTVVLGQTGFGKSYFVFGLIRQIMETSPDLNWIVFDWKGEYSGLLENSLVPVTVFRAGDPKDGFCLNMFNPQYQSPEEYAQQIFDIFTEVFAGIFETQTMELSSQMKRVFRDLLVKVIA